ncbi:LysR family transcriptional regulator [Myroides sp. M-43]|uniref:LysR family transcriptional regulator n=1 Tax=Myroides oncorhynchi TaxID=2893756 RepID=UPI001E654D18|nr:LysR family transcriptional regulator [Myroides oncorhynchi]MCC9043110.1 LysR family transcriptional regulator [Myroides oncorhynchi]
MKANLEWFRTFKAIYEIGTLSGAAKELYLTQPGVSLHINSLEAYTGFALFERTPRRMLPTERGKLLYQQILPSISHLEDVETKFKKKAGQDRITITIGMCEETFQQTLEHNIPTFDFNIIIQFGKSSYLKEQLKKGFLDLIITNESDTNKDIIYTHLAHETYQIVAGKQSCLDAFNLLKLKDKAVIEQWLITQSWYSTATEMDVLNAFWQLNFGHAAPFTANYIVPNKFSIVRCLTIGKGLGLLPDLITKGTLSENKLVKLWDGYKPLDNDLYLAKRSKTLFEDQIKQVEEVLIQEYHTMKT